MLLPEKTNPSTKELIVDILATNPELTAKQVYNKVRHSKPITYHAVFKLLNLMIDEDIITKDNKNYSLNPRWITDTKEYFQRLELSYNNRKESLIINKDTTHFILPSLHEGFFMLMRALDRGVFGDSKEIIGHFTHLLYLFISKEETALLKKLGREKKFYYLVNSKSISDSMIAYDDKRTFNYRTKLGVKCAEPFYLYVIGDTILQISIPKDISQAMERTYSHKFTATMIPKPRINQMTTFINEVAHKKVKIHVHVIKDKDTASQIREKTLRHF
ncbi:hypothetical protein KY328_06045 [Candidatus Woesearchaeota archaeon]|nr:hypothetical protein [Candidatus Woesearchaeota archaeon]